MGVQINLPEEFGGSGPPWSFARGFVRFEEDGQRRAGAFRWVLTNERMKWANSFADQLETHLAVFGRVDITVTEVHRV